MTEIINGKTALSRSVPESQLFRGEEQFPQSRLKFIVHSADIRLSIEPAAIQTLQQIHKKPSIASHCFDFI